MPVRAPDSSPSSALEASSLTSSVFRASLMAIAPSSWLDLLGADEAEVLGHEQLALVAAIGGGRPLRSLDTYTVKLNTV
jgi:hypothetical protein